ATTGQNALSQAREFLAVSSVDGVLLAKVDGTAKGGMAVAIARELKLPVLYLGVGETAEDLVEFRPREFAQALLA
ncbi:MAG TPA: signal recognition particle-docking protein FtsY, partial [Thermoanaerobaculia bacterium]|nr:signal recognition particle-docking protein FtsY [Thermoanaerobaculia bacterium]